MFRARLIEKLRREIPRTPITDCTPRNFVKHLGHLNYDQLMTIETFFMNFYDAQLQDLFVEFMTKNFPRYIPPVQFRINNKRASNEASIEDNYDIRTREQYFHAYGLGVKVNLN